MIPLQLHLAGVRQFALLAKHAPPNVLYSLQPFAFITSNGA